jgi:hypothetical protein
LFDRRAGTDAIQRARAWLARPDSDILWLGTGPENRGVVAVVAAPRKARCGVAIRTDRSLHRGHLFGTKIAKMAQSNIADNEIFDGGPPLRLEKSLGLIKPSQRRSIQRAVLVVAIVWAPLVVLSAIESLALGENRLGSLVLDLTVISRYLIAAPLFILAEGGTIFRIGQIANHFIDAGIVTAQDRSRFDAIIADSRRLLNSASIELLVVILAYLGVIVLMHTFPTEDIPPWHKASRGGVGYSWAGWWHALVSVPVALVLLLGWLWRLLIWGLFLFRVSRLDLRLVAAHPDLVGGLQFVGLSVRAFLLLSFAISTTVAGGVAYRVLYVGSSFFSFIYVIIAVVILSFLIFVGPLLVFGGKLAEARRRGIIDYGGLAGAVGSQLEKKWLDYRKSINEGALDVQHFSATIDLYQVASNVYQMKPFPIATQDLIALIVVTLLPFLPALLFEMPINDILSELVKLMF